MRTHQQLLAEIKMREELGLPRIELTVEERVRAFGDATWADRDPYAYEKGLVERMQQGLPMSIADKRRAKQFLRESNSLLQSQSLQ
jgi:hypothetical protein